MTHFLYTLLIKCWQIFPAKRWLAELIKMSNYLKKKLYKDLRYKGSFKTQDGSNSLTLYNSSYTTIENEIFWNGLDNGWEKISLNIWRHFASTASVIVDVGANTGLYSLIAANVNKNAQIHAFEPVSRTLSIFKKNIKLNNFNNIELHQIALSNSSGTELFYDVTSEHQYSASLNKEMLLNIENRIEYSVQTLRLDEFEMLKGKKIDLIKIDVEMHEVEVLSGMLEQLNDSRPIVLIEILTDEIGEKVESFFKNLNYLYFNIDEIRLPEKVDHLKKSNHYNFLLLPEDKMEVFQKIEFKHVIQ